MKIVINDCFGGYGLSEDFLEKYGKEFNGFERSYPRLIAAIEEFGEEKSSGYAAKLRIVEIPDDCTDYYVNEYDGAEEVIYVKDGKLHWA